MPNPTRVKSKVKTFVDHGDHVYTVTFDLPKRYTRFRPGQFTHLALDEFDPTTGVWPESRVFSIASAPQQDELSLVFSAKGRFTLRMSQELCVGRDVWLKLPYGSFYIDDTQAKDQDIVLIAGGTGISPFIPYLIQANRSEDQRVLNLFYGIRRPQLFLFENELRKAHSVMKNLKINIYAEQDAKALVSGPWQSHAGRLNLTDILACSETTHKKSYFLSGPPVMISSFKNGLLQHGIDANNIRIDDWE